LYTEELLSRLPAAALGGSVGELCRKDPETDAPAAAALIETWVGRYAPPPNLVAHLTSADSSSFWSGFGELAVAAALDQLGFRIDMRPRVPGPEGEGVRTPDLLATRDGLRIIVEVFTRDNDAETERERLLLDTMAAELGQRIDLPPGPFLSLTSTAPVTSLPSSEGLNCLVSGINRWLAAGGEQGLQIVEGPLPLRGDLIGGDPESQIALTPLGGALGQSARIGRDITAKIGKYAHLVDDETRLTVAVFARGWKITEGQLVTAMLGEELVSIDRANGQVIDDRYSGRGAAVPGGPFDGGDASALAGAWFLERAGLFEHNPPAMPVQLSYIHNPYSTSTLTPEQVGAARQFRMLGDGVSWHGESRRMLLH
jgi:hypothetical protein